MERPQRLRPRLHYELLVCGLRGHMLEGTDARELRPEDQLFARELGGGRWFRCLRCDSWLPLAPPERPARPHPPAREEISLPLRGRALRSKIILRLIAVDRAFHFVVLTLLGVLVLLVAANQTELRDDFYRILGDFHGTLAAPLGRGQEGLVGELDKLLSRPSGTLRLIGAALLAYAVLEAVEAVGLWRGRRWAEYLTLVATAVFLPLELYELAKGISPLKVVALVVNVAIVVYLLYAKRLFGLRGGGAAAEAELQGDTGWEALEATRPERHQAGRVPP